MYGCVGNLLQEFSALYCAAGRFADAENLQIALADLSYLQLLNTGRPDSVQPMSKQKVLGKVLALETLTAPEAYAVKDVVL